MAGTTAAGIPAGGGNVGLAATVGARNTPAYVVDDTPVNESTYHAQFSFDPNTLTTGASGTAWATVFEGRTTTGQAFAVQYHRVGTGATDGQVRTVMSVLQPQPDRHHDQQRGEPRRRRAHGPGRLGPGERPAR